MLNQQMWYNKIYISLDSNNNIFVFQIINKLLKIYNDSKSITR